MNKKAQSYISVILIVIVLLALFIGGIYFLFVQVRGYMTYSKFCKNHTDLCYCDLFNGCSFKMVHSSSTSTVNGVQVTSSQSNNVKELCDLARKIKDKQMLFDAEC